MNTNKIEVLEKLAYDIRQKVGPGPQGLQTLEALAKAHQRPILTTGIADLDAAIGGLPKQAITFLHGAITSGMSTLAYRLIAEAQHQGQFIIYFDLSETVHADYAAEYCGLDENQFLLYSSEDLSVADALEIISDAIRLPYSGVIVLDTLFVSSKPGALTADLERLGTPLRKSSWTIIGVMRLGDQALCHPYAALQLLVRRQGWITSYGRKIGFQATISILKHRAPLQRRSVTFDVRPPRV